jgi:hypothetical protein
MKKYLDLSDTSDYPETMNYTVTKIKTTIGKFKDEINGVKMLGFTGLHSKNVCLLN